jgi:hypothetical protein
MTMNWVEQTVTELAESLRPLVADLCDCAECRGDVVLRALNQARPRYATSSTVGGAVTRVELAGDQARAELTVLVLDAMRQVAANPRHAR